MRSKSKEYTIGLHGDTSDLCWDGDEDSFRLTVGQICFQDTEDTQDDCRPPIKHESIVSLAVAKESSPGHEVGPLSKTINLLLLARSLAWPRSRPVDLCANFGQNEFALAPQLPGQITAPGNARVSLWPSHEPDQLPSWWSVNFECTQTQKAAQLSLRWLLPAWPLTSARPIDGHGTQLKHLAPGRPK